MIRNTSHHILNASANLLGFCLFIITSLHFQNKTANSLIDEFTSVVALFLTLSCLFSFVSIRTGNKEKAERMEKTADYLFILSLLGVFAIILFIVLNFWNK